MKNSKKSYVSPEWFWQSVSGDDILTLSPSETSKEPLQIGFSDFNF